MMAKVLTVATGLALALALASCGGGDGGAPTAEPTTPTPSDAVTPGVGEALQVIDGVEVVPLEFGGEVELPDDVALLVELGCTECDGPTTGLARVYRDPSGQVRTDTLFSVEAMGLPPRLVPDPKAPEGTREEELYISTFGLSSDGSDIVVGVCTRGDCGPLGGPTDDAEITLFRSLDGGVTWAEFAVLDGAYDVAAVAKGSVVLRGPHEPEPANQPGYQLFPSGEPLEPPAQASDRLPLSLPDGELVWPTDDGRLLRSDGSQFLALAEGLQLGSVPGGLLRPDPSGERLAMVVWIDRPRENSLDYYLIVVDLEGHVIKAFALDGFASVGGWLRFGLAVGNAVVPAEELTATPPGFSSDYLTLPALIDLDAGRVQAIPAPFLERYGRNRVLAVQHGPFARVLGTGSCLNIRAEPGAAGRVLECAADGVLLRGTGTAAEIDSETWQRVVTPGGIEGWASSTFLEGKPAVVTVNAAAHEAFLAWFEEYVEPGFSTDILPVEIQDGGTCWAVHDSSRDEYLYAYAACPGEGITRVRVLRQNGAWKAEQAHFQASVGKPSWEEILERILQDYELTPGVRTIWQRDDVVVVRLTSPDSPPGSEFLNTDRFTRGDDGLWRHYATYDGLEGGYGTPEDALIAYASRNFPELPVLGDCAAADQTRDVGKACWALQTDGEDLLSYIIGPTFSEGEVVELERVEFAGAPAWRGRPSDRFPY